MIFAFYVGNQVGTCRMPSWVRKTDMEDWEKFNETSLPKKEDFYSHLNMEDITDADSAYAKKFVDILK